MSRMTSPNMMYALATSGGRRRTTETKLSAKRVSAGRTA